MMRDKVYVDCGDGGYTVSQWFELWRVVWRVVAWSIAYRAAGGSCPGCSCEAQECAYCAHECL